MTSLKIYVILSNNIYLQLNWNHKIMWYNYYRNIPINGKEGKIMKFKDYKYERPNLTEIENNLRKLSK